MADKKNIKCFVEPIIFSELGYLDKKIIYETGDLVKKSMPLDFEKRSIDECFSRHYRTNLNIDTF